MTDALIKRVSVTYKCYEMYAHRGKNVQRLAGADSGGCTPPKIGKNVFFWRKIVIFHTKYPKNYRASLCSAQFF